MTWTRGLAMLGFGEFTPLVDTTDRKAAVEQHMGLAGFLHTEQHHSMFEPRTNPHVGHDPLVPQGHGKK